MVSKMTELEQTLVNLGAALTEAQKQNAKMAKELEDTNKAFDKLVKKQCAYVNAQQRSYHLGYEHGLANRPPKFHEQTLNPEDLK